MNHSWSEVSLSGSTPSPRDKMASAVIGENIYIFGGFGPQGMEDLDLVRSRNKLRILK